jgi:hypothetical protein
MIGKKSIFSSAWLRLQKWVHQIDRPYKSLPSPNFFVFDDRTTWLDSSVVKRTILKRLSWVIWAFQLLCPEVKSPTRSPWFPDRWSTSPRGSANPSLDSRSIPLPLFKILCSWRVPLQRGSPALPPTSENNYEALEEEVTHELQTRLAYTNRGFFGLVYLSFEFHVRPQDCHSFGPDRPRHGPEVQKGRRSFVRREQLSKVSRKIELGVVWA